MERKNKKALFPEETSGKVSQDIQHPGSWGHTAPTQSRHCPPDPGAQPPALSQDALLTKGGPCPAPAPNPAPRGEVGTCGQGHGSWQHAAQTVAEVSREAWRWRRPTWGAACCDVGQCEGTEGRHYLPMKLLPRVQQQETKRESVRRSPRGLRDDPALRVAVHRGAYLRLRLGKQPPPQNLPPPPLHPSPHSPTVQGLGELI